MNQKFRIKDSKEFEFILNNGEKKINKYFIIYYIQNQKNFSRFGLTFSKKFGKANKRNKYKRKLREIIRLNQNIFKKDYDYIIIIRKCCDTLNYHEMENELFKLI